MNFIFDYSNNITESLNNFDLLPILNRLSLSFNDYNEDEQLEIINNNENYMEDIRNRVLLSNNLIENIENDEDPINFINNTLYQEQKYKQVISDEGKEKLEIKKYKKEYCSNDSCPISLIDFKENDEILILPCKHGFIKESIEEWLETHSSECPVCRLKLPSKEILNRNHSEVDVTPIRQSRRLLATSLSTLGRIIHPYGRYSIATATDRSSQAIGTYNNIIPHSYIEDYIENDNEIN